MVLPKPALIKTEQLDSVNLGIHITAGEQPLQEV